MFPQTSKKLLADLHDQPGSARWEEFVSRYSPGLNAYATRHFPMLDADDLVQETFLVFIRRLPDFIYDPEINGAFHAYLIGILRISAFSVFRKQARERRRIEELDTGETPVSTIDDEHETWKQSAYKLVLHQFFSDPKTHDQTKRIFRRVALDGESPETVARDYHLTRNAVDQIKRRCLLRLQADVAKLVE